MAGILHFKMLRWNAIEIYVASESKIMIAEKWFFMSAKIATRSQQNVVDVFMKGMWSLVREYIFA